jgi:biopolymer transport protein ExbD
MITAPFIRAGLKVDLPNAQIREKQPPKSLIIVVNRFGQVYFERRNISDEELAREMEETYRRSPELSILVEGDQAAPYGRILAVMDAVRRAGYENVGLVLEELERR